MQAEKMVKERKRYEKPEATRFPLRPEEAVLGGCKTVSSGPRGGACGKPIAGCPSAAS